MKFFYKRKDMAEYWSNDEKMMELFKQQKEYKKKTLIFHKFNTRWAPEIWNYEEEIWEQYEPTMLEYTIQGIDIKNFLEENRGFKMDKNHRLQIRLFSGSKRYKYKFSSRIY